jgi:transcriptional regulator with XRE-family HTH domain
MDTLDKIILLIKEKGIEQKKFALDLGLASSAVTDWKSGRNKSYIKHIDKIASYFNVSTDYLLGNAESSAELQEIKKESLQKFEAILKLYNALIEIGYIKPDETLTDEKVDLLIQFITANRVFLEQLSKNGN